MLDRDATDGGRAGNACPFGPVLEQADRRFDQLTSKVVVIEQKLSVLDQGIMSIKTQAGQKADEITQDRGPRARGR